MSETLVYNKGTILSVNNGIYTIKMNNTGAIITANASQMLPYFPCNCPCPPKQSLPVSYLDSDTGNSYSCTLQSYNTSGPVI
jgi:hypothetical protein